MRLERLEINAIFDTGSMHVFHTPYPIEIDEPPTTVVVDGREYPGHVSFKQNGDAFEIIITPLKDAP